MRIVGIEVIRRNTRRKGGLMEFEVLALGGYTLICFKKLCL